jgi:hypothetical protein
MIPHSPHYTSSSRFSVALSFPGETRGRVAVIAAHLAATLGRDRVLYDRFHEAEFARPNLDVHLQELYHDHTELLVVLLCRDYARKEWCGLEWRAIRDLIKHRREKIMFLRFDDAPVSGVFSIDGYRTYLAHHHFRRSMGYRDQGGCGLDHQLRVLEDVANDFDSFADVVAAWYCHGIKSAHP